MKGGEAASVMGVSRRNCCIGRPYFLPPTCYSLSTTLDTTHRSSRASIKGWTTPSSRTICSGGA